MATAYDTGVCRLEGPDLPLRNAGLLVHGPAPPVSPSTSANSSPRRARTCTNKFSQLAEQGNVDMAEVADNVRMTGREGRRDHVLELIRQSRVPLDDDEIAEAAQMNRIYVNTICRRLAGNGLIVRIPGSRGKLVNAALDRRDLVPRSLRVSSASLCRCFLGRTR